MSSEQQSIAAPRGSYRDLLVWQKAMDLAELVYEASSQFPSDERFGLTSQIRRAAVSIASNIAEGHGRETAGAFAQFLRTARGSLKEVETQIILAGRLGFLEPNTVGQLVRVTNELGRMLHGLIASVERNGRR